MPRLPVRAPSPHRVASAQSNLQYQRVGVWAVYSALRLHGIAYAQTDVFTAAQLAFEHPIQPAGSRERAFGPDTESFDPDNESLRGSLRESANKRYYEVVEQTTQWSKPACLLDRCGNRVL